MLPYNNPKEFENNNYKNLPQDVQNKILNYLSANPTLSFADKCCIVKFLDDVLGIQVGEIGYDNWVYITPDFAEIENDYYMQCSD